jgi:hypothetical protein
MHRLPDVRWDLIICDEAHSMGAFPKPSKRAKDVATLIYKNKSKVILLSGTPTPESYSQMYHQVYGIPNSPFKSYRNFYGFARENVDVMVRRINGHDIKDYSKGTPKILDMMSPYTISFTQEEAGFVVETTENVLEVELQPLTYEIMRKLRKDLVVEGKDEVILADTAVKLMIKMHQLCSGTIKFESGNSKVIDDTKARFIKEKFKDKKIGIFYKFKEELSALKSVFGKEDLTEDLDEFNATEKSIALQIVSGREGISLRQAEALVYYNIDFSATSYWQSRDRMTTKDRLKNDVYWVFAKRRHRARHLQGRNQEEGLHAKSLQARFVKFVLGMTEQAIQSKRIKQLEAEGYYVIKLVKTNKNGIPDLIAIPPALRRIILRG